MRNTLRMLERVRIDSIKTQSTLTFFRSIGNRSFKIRQQRMVEYDV